MKLKQWRMHERPSDWTDIKRMDAKMKADIKRMDAASDRTFALSFASFAIASIASLKAAADVLMRRELAPRA